MSLPFFTGCEKKGRRIDGVSAPAIRVLIDAAPATMNPRFTLDAIGQRLQMLIFRSVTRLSTELEAKGDLAEKWSTENGGKTYRFRIKAGLVDHAGYPITAESLRTCFENYLRGAPPSPLRAAFAKWLSTEAKGSDLLVRLENPDPYLPKNISVLRYFSIAGDPEHPCREPKPQERIVANGDYTVEPYPERMETDLRLVARKAGAPDLLFVIARDETSRIFKLLNGDGDVALNSISPTKTDWIAEKNRGFRLIGREGTNASYLAFNLNDPVLAKLPVRQAIAHAIDRELLVRTKIRGQAGVASSFLVSTLPESISPRPFAFDPSLSEKLLDQAGYPRGKDGVRLHVRYKVSTMKSGLEIAQIYRDMLAKVGVALDLETVEPSVFLASIRKGNFQMYMSQWIGASDGSIYDRTLKSTNPDNRVHYRNAEVDRWIAAAMQELDFKKRKVLLDKIQMKMLEDLPYFPLWHWTNGMVFRDTIAPPKPSELSLSGSYVPLADLRFQK